MPSLRGIPCAQNEMVFEDLNAGLGFPGHRAVGDSARMGQPKFFFNQEARIEHRSYFGYAGPDQGHGAFACVA